MIKRSTDRSGYRRAAAGVMGCLLVGGALSVAFQQPVASGASLSGNPHSPRAMDVAYRTEPEAPFEFGLTALNTRAYRKWEAEHKPEPLETYTVQPGDSLWSIASEHGTDVETIVSLNPAMEVTQALQPGEAVQVVTRTESLDARSLVASRGAFTRRATEAPAPPEPVKAVAAVADAGPPAVQAAPVARQEAPAPAPAPAPEASVSAAAAKNTGWIWPISGGEISSNFGGRWGGWHAGIDIAIASGTPAVAASGGKVAFAGWDGGFGNCVIIDHGDGIRTRYAHASAILVSVGDHVDQGQPVVRVGNTGNSTGPHLHFEVIANGTAENPRNYLPAR